MGRRSLGGLPILLQSHLVPELFQERNRRRCNRRCMSLKPLQTPRLGDGWCQPLSLCLCGIPRQDFSMSGVATCQPLLQLSVRELSVSAAGGWTMPSRSSGLVDAILVAGFGAGLRLRMLRQLNI